MKIFSPYKSYPRWIRSIRKRFLMTKPNNFVHNSFGNKFLFNKNNFIDKRIFIHGNFEGEHIESLIGKANLFKPELFMDIGSNFGLYSIFISNKFPNIKIRAIEPDPQNFSQLCANCFINDIWDRVEAHQIAASDQDGSVRMERNINNPAENRISEEKADPNGKTITVPCRRLDDLFDFKNKRILAKIDVEHHELEVIAGMPNLLADNAWLMMIESFPHNIDRLKKLLADKGIRYIADWGDRNHLFSS